MQLHPGRGRKTGRIRMELRSVWRAELAFTVPGLVNTRLPLKGSELITRIAREPLLKIISRILEESKLPRTAWAPYLMMIGDDLTKVANPAPPHISHSFLPSSQK
jgi:hypothetical protein